MDKQNVEEYKAFCWIKGELGQEIIKKKYFSNLLKNVEILNGHAEHKFNNLKPVAGNFPRDLDIVGWDKNTNEVKFICEVKTTTTNATSFKAYPLTIAFMQQAKNKNIPIYLGIVRLNRELDRKVVKSVNRETKTYEIDDKLFDKELNYFLRHAKTELYTDKEFRMENGKFLLFKRLKQRIKRS